MKCRASLPVNLTTISSAKRVCNKEEGEVLIVFMLWRGGFWVFAKIVLLVKENLLYLKKIKIQNSTATYHFHSTKQFLYFRTLFSVFLVRAVYKTEILCVYSLLILNCLKRKCDSSGYFVIRSTSFPAVLHRFFKILFYLSIFFNLGRCFPSII